MKRLVCNHEKSCPFLNKILYAAFKTMLSKKDFALSWITSFWGIPVDRGEDVERTEEFNT